MYLNRQYWGMCNVCIEQTQRWQDCPLRFNTWVLRLYAGQENYKRHENKTLELLDIPLQIYKSFLFVHHLGQAAKACGYLEKPGLVAEFYTRFGNFYWVCTLGWYYSVTFSIVVFDRPWRKANENVSDSQPAISVIILPRASNFIDPTIHTLHKSCIKVDGIKIILVTLYMIHCHV